MRPLRYPRYHLLWCLGLILLGLSACSSSDKANDQSAAQTYYFLESLRLVEGAGLQLQSKNLTESSLMQALSDMDEGLKLAYQIDAEFLNQLDLRLGKNYQRYFVKGVETYRIGVEARNQDEQQQGLKLLVQWNAFWGPEQSRINRNLQSQ